MKKLMIIGDSIACSEGVNPHKGWVARISADLPEGWLLLNMSFTGDTTRLALEKMPVTIQKHHPDIVMVQLGMNDCNYWVTDGGAPRVSILAYAANLQEIGARAGLHGATRLFYLTSHKTPLTDKYPYADISYEQSRAAYSKIVRNYFSELIDIEKLVGENVTCEDGVHLNERGNHLYYHVVSKEIMKCVSSF